MNFNDIGVVIPVREGSSRIEKKVVRPFSKGKSLTQWKVEQILEFLPGQQIFISTESETIRNQLKKYPIKIHNRDEYLSIGHHAPFSEVITGIVRDIPYENIAWITAVVPFMETNDYIEGFKSFNKYCQDDKKSNDSLVSVNLLKEYLWDEKKPLNYEANKNHTISQNLPNIYRVTNGLYMRNRDDILKEEYFLGSNPYFHEVSKFAGVDIDDMEDFHLAQAIAENFEK